MIIKQIHINRFGTLSDFDIELKSGLNVIRGDNEKGKSTLFAFVKYIFYGISRQEREKYIPWGASSCSGYLVFEEDGKEYRIERETLESKAKDKISLYSDGGREMSADNVSDFFGVSEGIFTSTAFTGQMSGTHVNGQTIPDAIENILFSADETVGTTKALKKLDTARIDLWHKNKKGGKIFALKQEISKLEISLKSAEDSAKNIISLEDRIRSDMKRREKTVAEAAVFDEKLDEYDAYSRLEVLAKYDNAKKQCAESEKNLEAAKLSYAKNGFVPDRKYLDRLDYYLSSSAQLKMETSHAETAAAKAESDLVSLSTGNDKIRAMLEKAGGASVVTAVAEDTKAKLGKARALAFSSVALAVILLLSGTLTLILSSFGLVVPSALLYIASVGLAALSVISFMKLGKLNRSFTSLLAKFGAESLDELYSVLEGSNSAEGVRLSAQKKLDDANKVLNDARLALSDIDREIREFTSAYEEHGIDTLGEHISALRTIDEELTRLGRDHELLMVKCSQCREAADGIDKELAMTAIKGKLSVEEFKNFNVYETRKNRNFCEAQVKKLSERIEQDKANLSAAKATATHPSDIYSRLESYRAAHDAAMFEYEACLLASEMITKASDDMHRGVTPALAERAGELLKKFSAGKYESVGINGDFSLNFSAEGMTHNAELLSTGTQDIVYISLRIALWELLFRKMRAPLFFDDSFAHTDDTRLAHIIRTLSEIASDSQIVVLTCHRREGAAAEYLGGEVISL